MSKRWHLITAGIIWKGAALDLKTDVCQGNGIKNELPFLMVSHSIHLSVRASQTTQPEIILPCFKTLPNDPRNESLRFGNVILELNVSSFYFIFFVYVDGTQGFFHLAVDKIN